MSPINLTDAIRDVLEEHGESAYALDQAEAVVELLTSLGNTSWGVRFDGVTHHYAARNVQEVVNAFGGTKVAEISLPWMEL